MASEDIQEVRKKLEEHEKRIVALEKMFESNPEITKKQLSIKGFCSL